MHLLVLQATGWKDPGSREKGQECGQPEGILVQCDSMEPDGMDQTGRLCSSTNRAWCSLRFHVTFPVCTLMNYLNYLTWLGGFVGPQRHI